MRKITDLHSLSGKTVLVRVDTDVDIENGKILDDTRLQASLETITYLLKKQASVILLGHLGRPEGKRNEIYSLLPVAQWYCEEFKIQSAKFKIEDIQIGGFDGWNIVTHITLLENIRFYKEEEENDPQFAKRLASLGDYYVNEAFAVSHRSHASIVGIPNYIPSFAGFHLLKEIEVLGALIKNPKRPLAILIGGAKIETKLPLVEKMHKIADYVLVGGEVALHVKELIRVQHEKLENKRSMVFVADLDESGKDITLKSVENFIQVLSQAATIVWNGPVGEIGNDPVSETGTKKLANAIVSSPAYKVVGGGDSLALLQRLHLLNKFDFVSIGGGAMLEFLSGKELPGIKLLLES